MLYPELNVPYKHYKGGLYEVITLANCKDRNIPVVVYKSLLFGSIYTRDLNEWNDIIETDNKNKITKRFTKCT